MLFVSDFACFQIKTGRHAGCWKAVAQLRDETGKALKPKQLQRQTEDQARAAMAEWLRKRARILPSTSMSVQAMCDAYIERCRRRNRAKKTISEYERLRDSYVTRVIGHLPVRALQPAHVEIVIEGLPDKTAINTRAFLRAAINKIARKADPGLPNVAALAEPPAYKPEDGVQLTPENFALILTAEADPMRRALWLLLADSGLRPDEARWLTWFEIHRREDGWWIKLQDSKTEEGKKPVPISDALEESLRSAPRSSTYVFPSPRKKNRPLDDATIRRWWREIQETAQVPVSNVYQLRHFFGTVMARKVKDDVLARLMRHTDPRTSKRYYVDPFEKDLRDAVKR